MKLSKLTSDNTDFFVGLFLGKSGGGKTGAAASFVEAGKTLLVDLDRRALGIRGCQFLSAELLEANLDIEQPDPAKGFGAIDELLEMQLIKYKAGGAVYKTIIIDSASTLQAMLLEDSIRLKGAKVRKLGKVEFTAPDDYLYAQRAFADIWMNFALQIRCNLIFTGWVVDRWGKDPQSTNEYSDKIVVGQQMLATSKLAEQIPGFFDEVYLFDKVQVGGPNGPIRYNVYFETDLAKTSRPELHGRSPMDITGKSFYKILQGFRK